MVWFDRDVFRNENTVEAAVVTERRRTRLRRGPA